MKVDKRLLKDKIQSIIFNIFLIVPGIVFLFTGFQWLVIPENAASSLMMPLLEGAGLCSQIGDIGGMFLAMGLLVMGAVVTKRKDLLFSVAVILACIVLYRLLAFTLHSATFTIQLAVFEIVFAIWFFIASRLMSIKESEDGQKL